MAGELVDRLVPGMVLLADPGTVVSPCGTEAVATGADLLWRAKDR